MLSEPAADVRRAGLVCVGDVVRRVEGDGLAKAFHFGDEAAESGLIVVSGARVRPQVMVGMV